LSSVETLSLPLAGILPVLDQRGKTMSKFIKLIRNSKGATAIEYGLIAALIAVAAIAAMQNIGSKLGTTFNNAAGKL
jgi:pilus assembly protein Flp/PilA